MSVVVIAPKGLEGLSECLDDLKWAEDLVHVDTTSIKGSFSEWRNEGMKRAKGDWVLYIDSDEKVNPELKEEIEEAVKTSEYSAYAIPRRNFIFGKEFKHCGQWPDYQKRLFRKSTFDKWQGDVHEAPVFSGELGHLKNPFIHTKENNLSDMVEKTNNWSEIEARLMFEGHHPQMNIFRFFTAGLREFWLRFVVQLAFLDGGEGVIYGMYQVYSRLISYAKLWEMQLK